MKTKMIISFLGLLLLSGCSSGFEYKVSDSTKQKQYESEYVYKVTDEIESQIKDNRQRILVNIYVKDFGSSRIEAVREYMAKFDYDIMSISYDDPCSGSEYAYLLFEKVDYFE